MKSLHIVALTLLIISGLNIGLSSVGFNVIDMFLDENSILVRVIYLLIGVSAIFELVTHKSQCKICSI
ncbi:DUF378 domain-containing protein [Candidatus Gracilibacteria bacterium]|nr:DUF378 domain-containing protein [Candidatus Gracilibacteria bacterium]MCF7898543.1 DUF378 domain-containing protein [Candidatus Paceibacterota bacterium]